MRNQKGITLIALVITIIVLLILAGVTIAMLSGENGILGRATETKEANAEATAREQSNLAYMAVRTEIAAKKVKNGTYKPNGDTDELLKIAQADLQPDTSKTQPWKCEKSGSNIKMTFYDSSLNNTNHELVYTIALDDTTATLTGPTPAYRHIESSN